MQKQEFANSTRRTRLVMPLLLILPLILTACALPTVTWLPATPPGSVDGAKPIRAYTCSEIKIVQWHGGKVNADGSDALTRDDVTAALAQSNWEDQVRRLAGDTSSTIASVKLNNAVWHALCDQPAPP